MEGAGQGHVDSALLPQPIWAPHTIHTILAVSFSHQMEQIASGLEVGEGPRACTEASRSAAWPAPFTARSQGTLGFLPPALPTGRS